MMGGYMMYGVSVGGVMHQRMDLSRATACACVILKYFSSILLRVVLIRSNRSFLVRLRRYLSKFITHSHKGYRSRTVRYCRISSLQRYRLSYINSHMKQRLILSQCLSLSMPRSAIKNWQRTQGVAVCSQYSHQNEQKLHSQLRPSFSFMKLRRFMVYQFRKSIERISSRRISRSAKTTKAPFTCMQVQLARHSCLKAQSFSQMPNTSVFEADTFSIVFYSSRQRKQMVWIQLIYMDSLDLLRQKVKGCPCSKYWQGRDQNFSQKRYSYRAYVQICLVKAVYSSPKRSCSDFLQMSGLWTRTSLNWLIFCSALKKSSFFEKRFSYTLLDTYSPKTGAGFWKISIQSYIPHQFAINLVYFSCASSTSPTEPISEIADITLGISFVSNYSRQFSLRYSPLMQLRSKVIDISAYRNAAAKSRISYRHWEELAQSTALSLFFSQSNSSPNPISYINNASSQFFSRNFQFASFLIDQG